MEHLISRAPGPALRAYVDVLWFYRVDNQELVRDHVLPHGAFELVIDIQADVDNSVISGPQTDPMLVETGGNSVLVGVHFSPFGAAMLLRESARQFSNRDIPLIDVWPREVRSLHGLLQSASTPEEALDLLERELIRRIERNPRPHAAVHAAVDSIHRYQAGEPHSVGDLVVSSGLSHRRFNELFADHVGLTPKIYMRVQRFQRVLRQISSGQLTDWAALAFDHGYSDQAHMIREFREFSGLRPSAYVPRLPAHPNHVAAP